MTKLKSIVTIGGTPYTIEDSPQPGENWDDFTLRHVIHVMRWKNTNFPGEIFEDLTVVPVEA